MVLMILRRDPFGCFDAQLVVCQGPWIVVVSVFLWITDRPLVHVDPHGCDGKVFFAGMGSFTM